MPANRRAPRSTPTRPRRLLRQKICDIQSRGLLQRRQALQVELVAARSGISVNDSDNDRSRSTEQVDEIGQRIAELTVQRDERDSRIGNLRAELVSETTRYGEQAEAVITARVRGGVWEV